MEKNLTKRPYLVQFFFFLLSFFLFLRLRGRTNLFFFFLLIMWGELERELVQGAAARINGAPAVIFELPYTYRYLPKEGASPEKISIRGGRTQLPKFKFSAKFPIGLHAILQIQIKKFENDCYIMWKIILTENPSRFNVEPLGNTYAVHVTVALVGLATLNLALPAPPDIHHGCQNGSGWRSWAIKCCNF